MTSRSKVRRPASSRTTYCHTCGRSFHPLGIARHRAMHRDKREICEITFTDASTSVYDFRRPR